MTTQRTTPRERARAEMVEQIKAVARQHLAADGPDLSLRAVARDIGVVSSAVYRYFASRDELLTALILDAYLDLADTVSAAEQAVPRENLEGRWLALGRATREWAVAHPPEYALIYGSPVPGYVAPPDTIEPANRIAVLLFGVVRDAHAAGRSRELPAVRLPRALRAELAAIAAQPDFAGLPLPVLTRAMAAWTLLFGLLNFELFGRLTGGVSEHEAYFELQWRGAADHVGLG